MASGNPASKRASVPSVHSRNSSAADAPRGNVTSLEFIRPDFARGMYRVLLAHDLTGASEIALVRAARLTLERKGHLIVLHVVDGRLPARTIEARRTQARDYLEAEVRRWLGRRKLSYRIDVGVGEPAKIRKKLPGAEPVDRLVGRPDSNGVRGACNPFYAGRALGHPPGRLAIREPPCAPHWWTVGQRRSGQSRLTVQGCRPRPG